MNSPSSIAWICFLAIALSITRCNTIEEGPEARSVAQTFDFTIGDLVTVGENGATVYASADVNSLPVGVQAPGATGTVDNGPKVSGGLVWYRINFALDPDGLVLENDLIIDDNPPPPPPTGSYVLGMFGCSQTRDVLKGLDAYPEIPNWPQQTPDGTKIAKSFSGKTLMNWGDPSWNGYNLAWRAFDDAIAYMPETNIIIFEPCMSIQDREDVPTLTPAEVAAAQHVAARVAEKAPWAVFYVVPMNGYEEGHICPLTGANGTLASIAAADTMAAITQALRADLVLGPLAGANLKGDGCHATASGMDLEAQQVIAWLNAQ